MPRSELLSLRYSDKTDKNITAKASRGCLAIARHRFQPSMEIVEWIAGSSVFRDRAGKKAVPLVGDRDANDAFGKISNRLLSRREHVRRGI